MCLPVCHTYICCRIVTNTTTPGRAARESQRIPGTYSPPPLSQFGRGEEVFVLLKDIEIRPQRPFFPCTQRLTHPIDHATCTQAHCKHIIHAYTRQYLRHSCLYLHALTLPPISSCSRSLTLSLSRTLSIPVLEGTEIGVDDCVRIHSNLFLHSTRSTRHSSNRLRRQSRSNIETVASVEVHHTLIHLTTPKLGLPAILHVLPGSPAREGGYARATTCETTNGLMPVEQVCRSLKSLGWLQG